MVPAASSTRSTRRPVAGAAEQEPLAVRTARRAAGQSARPAGVEGRRRPLARQPDHDRALAEPGERGGRDGPRWRARARPASRCARSRAMAAVAARQRAPRSASSGASWNGRSRHAGQGDRGSARSASTVVQPTAMGRAVAATPGTASRRRPGAASSASAMAADQLLAHPMRSRSGTRSPDELEPDAAVEPDGRAVVGEDAEVDPVAAGRDRIGRRGGGHELAEPAAARPDRRPDRRQVARGHRTSPGVRRPPARPRDGRGSA